MNKITIPQDVKRVKDPHHEGNIEWCFYNDDLYQRCVGQTKWNKVNKTHATPKRAMVLSQLSC